MIWKPSAISACLWNWAGLRGPEVTQSFLNRIAEVCSWRTLGKSEKLWKIIWVSAVIHLSRTSSRNPEKPTRNSTWWWRMNLTWHGAVHGHGGSQKWMVYFMENPIYKWMMTGSTPILGNPHMVFIARFSDNANHFLHCHCPAIKHCNSELSMDNFPFKTSICSIAICDYHMVNIPWISHQIITKSH